MVKLDKYTAPVLVHLMDNARTQNLFGSPMARKSERGPRHFFHYADQSLLFQDSVRGKHCFLTQEGRKLFSSGSGKRAVELITDPSKLSDLVHLGSGTFSTAFVFDDVASIAVKVTSPDGFLKKEFSAALADEADDVSYSSRGKCGRKIVQHLDLPAVLDIQKRMIQAGLRVPSFYGFCIDETGPFTEFQFMSLIRAPTIEVILEEAMNARSERREFNFTSIPNSSALAFARQHFSSDEEWIKAVAHAFRDFHIRVKNSIHLFDLGDINPDNLFVTGFDVSSKQFDLTMIDPIREINYIRPVSVTPTLQNNLITTLIQKL